MKTPKITGLAVVACGALLFAMPAKAVQLINGSFGGSGWATVSFSNLNFCPNGSTPNGANQAGACTPGIGNVSLGGGAGSFTGVTGNLNQILSLNSVSEPVGATVSVPGWMTFIPSVGAPPISLTLTSVLAGSFSSLACGSAPAAGQTCTPPGSAFNLQNQTISSSSATFDIIGNAVDGAGGSSPFLAIFSSQFNVPYQSLLAALSINSGTGNYSGQYSVSVSASAVPEPMTLSMMGIGLLGLGLIARRRESSALFLCPDRSSRAQKQKERPF